MSIINKALVFLIVVLLAVGISLLVPEVREVIVNLAVYGRLTIGDSGPTVEKIYIQDEGGVWVECPEPPDFFNCYREITPGGTESVNIRTQIYDSNDDCDVSYDVDAWVCMNQTGSIVCNDANDDPDGGSLSMAFVAPKINNRCNYSATYTTFDYWKKYGVWYINISAIDTNIPNQPDSITRKWFSSMRGSLSYPYPGPASSIYLGDVNLGAWTDNRGENVTRNTGNVRLNKSWQSTNFTCPLCTPQTDITIDNTNEFYCVDNDANRGNGCRYFDAVPPTTVWWYPNNGMRRCGNDPCSTDEDGGLNQANYTLWYHIYVETGKTSGDYNNTLDIRSYTCDLPAICGTGGF